VIILRNVELVGQTGTCDIQIEHGQIREIGPAGALGQASAIPLANAIAFPGLINSHDHLEFDVYEQLDGGPYRDYLHWAQEIKRRHAERINVLEALPRAVRIRAGIAKNLLCGVTTVAHHGVHAEYTGSSMTVVAGTRTIHSPRMEGRRGLLVPDRRPVVVHIGEGTDDQSMQEIDAFTRWNVWRKTLIGVHGIAMRADQAPRFAAIVWCPVSNEFLYGKTAAISELKHRTAILFGTDATLSGPWSIWTHIRRARALNQLSDKELIDALTATAARTWRLSNNGRLEPGAAADVVVAEKRFKDSIEAFFAVEPENILLVIKHGRVVLCDASLRSYVVPETVPFTTTVNGRQKFTAEDCGASLSKNEIAPYGRSRW
jgi:cytosine/adenosine deaminase-related metal-dependent hydrolase